MDASTIRRRNQIEARLARASFRLEMAQVERIWAVVSARRDGWSVRDIAKRVGLSSTRVHQLISDPKAAFIDHVLSTLREIGWTAPEDQVSGGDEQVADRLVDEAATLVRCAKWLDTIAGGSQPVVNLRPDDDWPDTDNVIVDQSRIVRMLRRIASDIDELARARRVADLSSNTADADPRMRRRRRLGELPIESPKGPLSIHQGRRAWDEYQARLRRAGLPIPPNPYRFFERSGK
jgi:hypothetical protein